MTPTKTSLPSTTNKRCTFLSTICVIDFAGRVVQRNRQHNRGHDITDLAPIDILHLKALGKGLIGMCGQVCPFVEFR